MDQNRLKIKIEQGQTLWDALADKGIVLDRPCGGRGVCGRCAVIVEGIGRVNACQFVQEGTWQITLDQSPEYTIVQTDISKESGADAADLKKAAITAENPTFREPEIDYPYVAVDIGTTTVALTGICGGVTFQDGFVNPQRRYGADVVSRISAANTGHADELKELLKTRLMEALDSMTGRWRISDFDIENGDTCLDDSLCRDKAQKQSCDRDEQQSKKLCKVYIAGNTTMLHILRGFSCEGLGQAPFTPVSLEAGTEIWQGQKARYEVHFAPGISTYVGADIVSGIYALQMAEREEISLLLDLGTNGEMALGNCRHMLCASAAAGPAFEGGQLASRIHASGILKCLHDMLDQGIIDETGLLADTYFEEGYPVRDEICCTQEGCRDQIGSRIESEECMVQEESTVQEECTVQEEIHITQDDIREIQMAKGAISAGIDILLKEYGISPDQVSHVYLAGGMGYYLNPDDAIAIGLLPDVFSGRIQAVGNTSLRGLLRSAKEADPSAAGELSEENREGVEQTEEAAEQTKETAEQTKETAEQTKEAAAKVDENRKDLLAEIAAHTQEIVLAQHPDFEKAYISGMNFPVQR